MRQKFFSVSWKLEIQNEAETSNKVAKTARLAKNHAKINRKKLNNSKAPKCTVKIMH